MDTELDHRVGYRAGSYGGYGARSSTEDTELDPTVDTELDLTVDGSYWLQHIIPI